MNELDRMRRALLSVWCIAASVALLILFAAWRYDDPYITYRYAENIARGIGFVYNPGERVLSTTAPAFALLLAAVRMIGVTDVHAAATAIGCASVGGGAWAAGMLAYSWGRPRAASAAIVLYALSALLLNALSSETPLFLALSLGALAAYARRRWMFTAVLAGLALLVRGDGALLVGLLCMDYLWINRAELRHGRLRVPWAALAVFALLVGAWVLWATLYFGAPFPVTLAAKRAQGLMRISTSFFTGLSGLPRYLPQPLRWFEIGLAAFGVWTALRRRRAALLPIVWTLLYVTAYSALGVTRYFWYYAPIVPGFVLALALGLDEAFEWIAARRMRFESLGFGLLVAAIAVVHAVSIVQSAARTDPRYAIYRAAGEWLHANTPPNARLGMLEVGIIGYYADRAVVDFAGLVQPEVAKQIVPESTYDDLALYAINTYRPDWLVLIDGALPQAEARGHERCTVRQQFAGGSFGAPISLTISQCR